MVRNIAIFNVLTRADPASPFMAGFDADWLASIAVDIDAAAAADLAKKIDARCIPAATVICGEVISFLQRAQPHRNASRTRLALGDTPT
jgi:hypothetical protein